MGCTKYYTYIAKDFINKHVLRYIILMVYLYINIKLHIQ